MARLSTKKATKPRSALSKRGQSMLHGRWPYPTRFPNFWSYSRWSSWRDCPHAYLLSKIMKVCPPPQGKAAERGDMIHRMAQAYLEGKTKGMPDELAKFFREEFQRLKSMGAVAEGDWTLTEDLKKTIGTDWDRAWLRVRIDARLMMEAPVVTKRARGKKGGVVKTKTLVIVDYKTGRFRVDVAQMEIYAATAIHYFDFDEVTVELWFLDQDQTEVREWNRKEAEELWEKWSERGKRMLADREFKPNPETEKCKKCTYSSANRMTDGSRGPCEAWKEAS